MPTSARALVFAVATVALVASAVHATVHTVDAVVDTATYHYRLGMRLLDEGDNQRAVTELSRCQFLAPSLVGCRDGLALARARLHDVRRRPARRQAVTASIPASTTTDTAQDQSSCPQVELAALRLTLARAHSGRGAADKRRLDCQLVTREKHRFGDFQLWEATLRVQLVDRTSGAVVATFHERVLGVRDLNATAARDSAITAAFSRAVADLSTDLTNSNDRHPVGSTTPTSTAVRVYIPSDGGTR